MAPVAILLHYITWAFFVVLIVRIAFSYIGPNWSNPFFRISYQLTEPILRPIRNLLPQGMGIDFSPMVVMFALYLLQNVIDGMVH
ncbi:MAG TPA: YggT family protein [Candidatus Dormibacteraeota bacterium]|jgi:YggT family protein|nr:YggT family protein [Candidatus Dormibacteraeota bacterium]